MADGKVTISSVSVEEFLAAVEPPSKREEAQVLGALFRKVTGQEPKMWGPSIIGYGEYSTTFDSGRNVHWLKIGFSPRKAKHSVYLSAGYGDAANEGRRAEALARLGKHTMGKGCRYVNKLADVDMAVLEELIASDWQTMQRAFPEG